MASVAGSASSGLLPVNQEASFCSWEVDSGTNTGTLPTGEMHIVVVQFNGDIHRE